MHFILVDGSYFVFYRFHAMLTWWKNAKEEVLEFPSQSKEFVEKFNKLFIDKCNEIPKKINKIISHEGTDLMLVAKDCSRKDIWRMKHLPEYKGTRVHDDKFEGKYFFKLAYEELFKKTSAKTILSCPNLEADDCIALTIRHITNKYPDAHISIIANDMDYLQLCSSNIKLYDLKYNDLSISKKSTGDPKKDLFCKIVTGDKSDNISGVFPRCGLKTALKYYDDSTLFEAKLSEKTEYKEIYERNKLIIDFNNIPQDLVELFDKDILKL